MRFKTEGHINVPGGRVWYKIVGEKTNKLPIIVLHGGPGYPHNYLKSIENLSDERQVIFYDQLGCGKSDHPTDTKFWTVERFVAELTEVVKTLKLEQYHVLGQSWGAALAGAFALQKPKGLVSLIFNDPYLSTHVWMQDAKRLIRLLPEDKQRSIEKYKKDVIETKEYKEAKLDYYKMFVRGYKRTPLEVIESRTGNNNDIYNFMWGPAEFLVTGTLKNFDLTPRLSEIKVPVLLVCGRFDEATPQALKYFKNLLSNADIKIFEKSAHNPHLTEKEEYIKTLRAFLQKIES